MTYRVAKSCFDKQFISISIPDSGTKNSNLQNLFRKWKFNKFVCTCWHFTATVPGNLCKRQILIECLLEVPRKLEMENINSIN